MNWREHLIVNFSLSLLLLPLFLHFYFLFFFIHLAVSSIFTLLPDLDTKAKIDSLMKRRMVFILLFPFYLILAIPSKLSKTHRTFSHSFLSLILICFVYFLVTLLFPLPIFIVFSMLFGYLNHLLSDATTVKGIAFFYPKRILLSGKLTSGKNTYRAVILIFILSFLFSIFNFYIYFNVGYISVTQVLLYIFEYFLIWILIFKTFQVKRWLASNDS